MSFRTRKIHTSSSLTKLTYFPFAFTVRPTPSGVRAPKDHLTSYQNSGSSSVARRQTRYILAFAVILALSVLPSQLVSAQTFNVLHSFTGGGDGASPSAGLTRDNRGNFYGTTKAGGAAGPDGFGTVFKLSYQGSGWTLSTLYSFAGASDGAGPVARIIIGPDGSLYGATANGGGSGCGGNGCGTIFNLKPPANAATSVLSNWTETVLYRFTGGNDGALPVGDLVFDPSGNVYGVTSAGGSSQKGVVYQLTPSNGHWTESVLWSFTGGNDGGQPAGGVIFDSAGKLYGTTQFGGANRDGAVFQLTHGQSGWTQSTLYSFQNGSDGENPYGALTFDSSGNLYGTTVSNGRSGGGTVFELTPRQNGTWAFAVLYSLSGHSGGGPQASLTMSGASNLYGTTYQDGAYGHGSAMGLTLSSGSWIFTDLHDFTNGNDGAEPMGNLVLDGTGTLYGTAFGAGAYGYGVIFEITPLQITTTSLPAGRVNTPYNATLAVSGGVPPYTWRVTRGSLPPGLTLNAGSGAISGTPTTSGAFSFTVQVSDSESPPATASAALGITIQSSLLITTSSLPSGTVGMPYSASLTATGGLAPYTWSLIQGTLPNGLTLTAGSGAISGTPTVSGTFNFTVKVSDSESPPATATAPLGITVSASSIFLSWDGSTSLGVIGYNAYRGTVSGGPYTKINSALISNTTYNDQAIQSGHTYYYVTTAVNNQGQESTYSNQASATAP